MITDEFSENEIVAAIDAVRKEIDATGYGSLVPADFIHKVAVAALEAISKMRSTEDH